MHEMYPKCIVVGIRYLIELFVPLSVVGKKGKVGGARRSPGCEASRGQVPVLAGLWYRVRLYRRVCIILWPLSVCL